MEFEQWVVLDPRATGCPVLLVTDSREEAEAMARKMGGRVVRLSEVEE